MPVLKREFNSKSLQFGLKLSVVNSAEILNKKNRANFDRNITSNVYLYSV